MTMKRRALLRHALSMLGEASVILDSVCDSEQDAMDNYPENLQGTDRFEAMELAVESLGEAAEKLDEVKDHIETAIK